MKKPAWFLLLLLIALQSTAQKTLPAVFEIKDDTTHQYDLVDPLVLVLFDRTDSLTISDVMAAKNIDSFRFISSINKKKEKPAKTYWFVYRLKNIMSFPARIAFNSSSMNDDYYVLNSAGNIAHFISGYVADPQKKSRL